MEKLARTLEEAVRGVDLVARYGGDEFVIILHNTDNPSSRVVAEKIRKAIEEKTFWVEKHPDPIRIKVSLGGDTFIRDFFRRTNKVEPAEIEKIIDMLINSIDKALYQAKKQGGNRVIIHNLEYSTQIFR